MTSSEVQEYLENKSYKLTLEEYYALVGRIIGLCYIRLDGVYDFFSKLIIGVDDNRWGVYVLNYGVDDSKLADIVY